MNEVKIYVPDGCELIQDGNTYIVREKKQGPPRSWGEFCMNYRIQPQECFINNGSAIIQLVESSSIRTYEQDKNLCTSKEEAEAFLALIQLRQLRKAWVGDWEITDQAYYCIIPSKTKITVLAGSSLLRSLSFPTKEMADDFLNCFKDLCEQAKILL